MKKEQIKSMLISVGGAPAPIIKSIELNNPEKIIFFVSRDSYESVTKDILPEVMKISGSLPPHEIVITPDFQDVGESAFALLREVPPALNKLGIKRKWPEIVDYTGGTKSMSSATIWASSKFPCTFSYIGSETTDSRTKGGLGIVIDGKERCLLLENPWNAIAYYDVNHAVNLFNTGQYSVAVEIMEDITAKVTAPHRKRFLNLVCSIWRGYAAWDRFDHRTANREFGRNIQALIDSAPQEEPLWHGIKKFSLESQECYETLKNLEKEKKELSWSKIYDLMANAMRRADLEKKYDDATARCYAAIEKYGKHALKLRYGIDNSKCRLEQLPETLYAEYKRKYLTADDIVQFGLQATYKLLATLGDNTGKRFEAIETEMNKFLQLRNNSILGHGVVSVKKENFYRLFELALKLMNLKKDDLTQFPVITNS